MTFLRRAYIHHMLTIVLKLSSPRSQHQHLNIIRLQSILYVYIRGLPARYDLAASGPKVPMKPSHNIIFFSLKNTVPRSPAAMTS